MLWARSKPRKNDVLGTFTKNHSAQLRQQFRTFRQCQKVTGFYPIADTGFLHWPGRILVISTFGDVT